MKIVLIAALVKQGSLVTSMPLCTGKDYMQGQVA